MIAGLVQPLEIQEVGGPSFLESLAGPALIAIAAIIAAFVAAWVARRNHAEQLEHDRDLRNLDYARRSINSAIETVAEVVDTMGSYAGAVWMASDARAEADETQAHIEDLGHFNFDDEGDFIDTREVDEVEATSPEILRAENEMIEAHSASVRAETEAIKRVADMRSPAFSSLSSLSADTFRLRITIGARSDVIRCHAAVRTAFEDWKDKLNPDAEGRYRLLNPEDDVQKIVAGPIEEFVNACQRWSAEHP